MLAEELGFDGFGVGERHERPFISSSPPVVLSHIAALTSRIRLFTAVTTLSLLDPVRAYEDYATLDHLSDGRLELIIGKGNGAAQRELFHVTPEDQWDRNAESYELFRRLWREDKVTCDAAVPAGAARRRGLAAAAAAADPGLARQRHQPGVGRPGRPLRRPAVLGQRHQPDRAVRRAGPLLPRALGALRPRPGATPRSARAPPATTPRRTSQDALRRLPADLRRPAARSSSGSGCTPVFPTLEDFVERSSALIGSPQQIIDKVHRYHEQFGHSVLHLHADAGGLTDAQHRRVARAVPVRHRAGAAPRHPRPAAGPGGPRPELAVRSPRSPALTETTDGHHPARRPRPRADLAPARPPPRPCATPSTSPSRPSGSATPGTGSPSTTSTPASPAPRPPSCSR